MLSFPLCHSDGCGFNLILLVTEQISVSPLYFLFMSFAYFLIVFFFLYIVISLPDMPFANIGAAKKFIRIFPYDLTNFLPTQYFLQVYTGLSILLP